MRKASSKEFKSKLARVLTPWHRQERSGPNDPYWIGHTRSDFVDDTKKLDRFIQTSISKGQDRYAEEWLINNRGYNPWEAEITVDEVYGNKQRKNTESGEPMLRQRAFGVPNTEADELLSKLLLSESGFDSIRRANGNPVFATDILGAYGGRDVGIDAQTRTRADGWSHIRCIKRIKQP